MDDGGDDIGGKDSSPKGSKGPWGGANKDRRSVDGGRDAQGKKDTVPPNPWSRREESSSSEGNSIDDLVDALQDRVKKLMSGGGGNPPGNARGGTPRGSWKVVALLAAGVAVLWLGTGLYRVQEGEVGVVLRFGEMVRTSSPGLQYHLPKKIRIIQILKNERKILFFGMDEKPLVSEIL